MAETPRVYVNENGEAAMIDPGGNPVWIPEAEAASYAESGYMPETKAEIDARHELEAQAQKYDSPALATLAGLARGATGGLSDLALTGTGLVDQSTLAGLREHNPIASGVGDVAGTLLPFGPVGLAGKAASGLAGRAGAGLLAQAVTRGAAEGGAIAAGQSISDEALDSTDDDFDFADVVDFAKNVGTGAAAGGGLALVGNWLGSLGRFAKDKVSGLTSEYKSASKSTAEFTKALDAQESKIKDLDALWAKRKDMSFADQLGSGLNMDILKLERELAKTPELGASLDDIAQLRASAQAGLAATKTDAIANAAANLAAKGAAHAVAGTLAGGLASALPGPLGAAAAFGGFSGWLTSSLKNKVIKSLQPITRATVKGTVKYTPPVIAGAGKLVKTITPKEFVRLRSELINAPSPEEVYKATFDRASQTVPPEIADRVAGQAARSLATITEAVLGPESATADAIPTGVGHYAPGRQQLHDITNVVNTVINPEQAVKKFIAGTLSRAEARTLNTVYPDEANELFQAIVSHIEDARTRGESFDRRRAAQIKVFQSSRGDNAPGTPAGPGFAQLTQQQQSGPVAGQGRRVNSAALSSNKTSKLASTGLGSSLARLNGG